MSFYLFRCALRGYFALAEAVAESLKTELMEIFPEML